MQHGFAPKQRVEERVRAMVRAIMRDSREERDVCLIDISTRGLLATTARPPSNGEIVELRVGRTALVGQVRWSSERRFGVVLRDRVIVADLIENGSTKANPAKTFGARQHSPSPAGENADHHRGITRQL